MRPPARWARRRGPLHQRATASPAPSNPLLPLREQPPRRKLRKGVRPIDRRQTVRESGPAVPGTRTHSCRSQAPRSRLGRSRCHRRSAAVLRALQQPRPAPLSLAAQTTPTLPRSIHCTEALALRSSGDRLPQQPTHLVRILATSSCNFLVGVVGAGEPLAPRVDDRRKRHQYSTDNPARQLGIGGTP